MGSLVVPIKLGRPVNRHLEDELSLYIPADEWQALCDALDDLTMNLFDRNASILMRFSLMVAIACLVLVILFGYLDSSDDSDDGENDENANDHDSDSKDVSTLLVLVTAVPISFPFIMAAVLNCHASATISKIVQICRTQCQAWADERHVNVTVELLESVSNEDEVLDKILIQFGDPSKSSSETTGRLSVDSGAPTTSSGSSSSPQQE